MIFDFALNSTPATVVVLDDASKAIILAKPEGKGVRKPLCSSTHAKCWFTDNVDCFGIIPARNIKHPRLSIPA